MDIKTYDLTGPSPLWGSQHVCHTKITGPRDRHTWIQILVCHLLPPSYLVPQSLFYPEKTSNSQGSCENAIRKPSPAQNVLSIKFSFLLKKKKKDVSFLLFSFIGICLLGVKVIKRISEFPRLAFCGSAPLQGSPINTHSSPSPMCSSVLTGLITGRRSQSRFRPSDS